MSLKGIVQFLVINISLLSCKTYKIENVQGIVIQIWDREIDSNYLPFAGYISKGYFLVTNADTFELFEYSSLEDYQFYPCKWSRKKRKQLADYYEKTKNEYSESFSIYGNHFVTKDSSCIYKINKITALALAESNGCNKAIYLSNRMNTCFKELKPPYYYLAKVLFQDTLTSRDMELFNLSVIDSFEIKECY